jgi:hypothetical protein
VAKFFAILFYLGDEQWTVDDRETEFRNSNKKACSGSNCLMGSNWQSNKLIIEIRQLMVSANSIIWSQYQPVSSIHESGQKSKGQNLTADLWKSREVQKISEKMSFFDKKSQNFSSKMPLAKNS